MSFVRVIIHTHPGESFNSRSTNVRSVDTLCNDEIYRHQFELKFDAEPWINTCYSNTITYLPISVFSSIILIPFKYA